MLLRLSVKFSTTHKNPILIGLMFWPKVAIYDKISLKNVLNIKFCLIILVLLYLIGEYYVFKLIKKASFHFKKEKKKCN